MFSRKTRLAGIAAAAVVTAGTAAGALATSASASTAIIPPVQPRVCALHLGPNIMELTFQGQTFDYPVLLHENAAGVVRGLLFDRNLPVGHQTLRVNGLCINERILLGTDYLSPNPQGFRGEVLTGTPNGHPHRADVKGAWTEDGTEQGSGQASFVFPFYQIAP